MKESKCTSALGQIHRSSKPESMPNSMPKGKNMMGSGMSDKGMGMSDKPKAQVSGYNMSESNSDGKGNY